MGNVFTLIIAGIGFVLFYAAGRWLIDTGLRGRRVGEHPYCKKCGFDLTGKPDASTRCAECGPDPATKRTNLIPY